MPQLITISNPCPKCRAEFEAQRTEYCREFLRYQRENFSHRTEINALEAQLKHALEKLLKAERELIQAWKTSQHAREGFNAWWDAEYDDSDNRFEKDSAAYWAWAGWQAAKPEPEPEPEPEPKHIAQSNGKYSPLLTHMFNKRTQETPKCSPA